MTDKLKQTIKEELLRLPKEVQGVISIFDWEKISKEIGKKYFLDENEINILQSNIGLVLVEGIEQNRLALKIENDVGTSKKEAEEISDEIRQKIFKPMVDKLNESIKKSLHLKNIHWQQNLDFILSGGDYTAFIKRVENPASAKASAGEGNTTTPRKINDLRDGFTI